MRETRRGTSSQQGAVMIWVGVSLVAMLTATFLAIDVGRLYFTQRDLQRLASLAAVSAAQAASGCVGADQDGRPGDVDDVTRLVRSFVVGNGGKPEYLTGVNDAPPVELGKLVRQNHLRLFQSLPEGDPDISAVRVSLTRPQPRPFIGFLSGGRTLRASATAEQTLNASFNVGSTLLGVGGGLFDQTLSAMLCAAGDTACRGRVIGLKVASFATGLAATSISLGQMAAAAQVSVQDLSDPLVLSTQTVLLPQMLAGLSANLGGGASAQAVQLLRSLAAAASANTQPIALGRIIGDVDASASDVPLINLLDLLMTLGIASHDDAHGLTPVELPLVLNVPAGVTISSYLRVLQPAQASGAARPGTAQARTAQLRLEIRIHADQLLNAVASTVNSLIGGALQAQVLPAPLNLGIDIDVAPATAYLDAIRCPSVADNHGAPVVQLSVARALADIAVGRFSGTPTARFSPPLQRSADPIDLLTLRSGGSTRTLRLAYTTASVGGGPDPVPLQDVTEFLRLAESSSARPPVYAAMGSAAVTPLVPVAANPQTLDSPLGLDLHLGLSIESSAAGESVPPLANTVLEAVQVLVQPLLNLVNGLATGLVDPVLGSMGIEAGAATVTLEAVQIGRPQKTATCIPGGGGARACQAP